MPGRGSPTRTACPRASPGLDAVTLWLCLLSHSQDNPQLDGGVCGQPSRMAQVPPALGEADDHLGVWQMMP